MRNLPPKVTRGGGANPPPAKLPCEPSLLSCARELFSYLCELQAVQGEARHGLLSPEPAEISGNSESADDSLEATLGRSCRMAACLVGEARTMNAKLLG